MESEAEGAIQPKQEPTEEVDQLVDMTTKLYSDHEIKDELVIGPVVLQKPGKTYVGVSSKVANIGTHQNRVCITPNQGPDNLELSENSKHASLTTQSSESAIKVEPEVLIGDDMTKRGAFGRLNVPSGDGNHSGVQHVQSSDDAYKLKVAVDVMKVEYEPLAEAQPNTQIDKKKALGTLYMQSSSEYEPVAKRRRGREAETPPAEEPQPRVRPAPSTSRVLRTEGPSAGVVGSSPPSLPPHLGANATPLPRVRCERALPRPVEAAAPATAAQAAAAATPPFVECGGEGSAQSTPPSLPMQRPPRRPNQILNDKEITNELNYGSEPGSDESDDDELVSPFIPRVYRSALETPMGADDGVAFDQPTVEDPAPAAASTSFVDVPPTATDQPWSLYDFQWRAFPNPLIPPGSRRETFSESNFGPTIPCVDPYDIFITI